MGRAGVEASGVQRQLEQEPEAGRGLQNKAC